MIFVAWLWKLLKAVPFQVWLGIGLLVAVWWWHSSAVSRAVDACNEEWEAKVAQATADAAKAHTDAQGAIAADAVPANAKARQTLDGIAADVRKLRSQPKSTGGANSGCVAEPETVEEVNALR